MFSGSLHTHTYTHNWISFKVSSPFLFCAHSSLSSLAPHTLRAELSVGQSVGCHQHPRRPVSTSPGPLPLWALQTSLTFSPHVTALIWGGIKPSGSPARWSRRYSGLSLTEISCLLFSQTIQETCGIKLQESSRFRSAWGMEVAPPHQPGRPIFAMRCSAETDKTWQLARITVKANTMQVQKKTKYEMAKSSTS